MNKDTDKNKMVIEFGGKQHLAEPGTRIVVNQSDSKEGESVVAKDLLSGKDITLKVIKTFKGTKINGMKFKSKSRYTRRYGHRQHLMILEVVDSKESKSSDTKKSKQNSEKKTSISKKKTTVKAMASVK